MERGFARHVGDVIQIARWIEMFQIDGGADDAFAQGKQGNCGFDSPRRPHRMPDHRLGRTHGEPVSMLTKQRFDGGGFRPVIEGG